MKLYAIRDKKTKKLSLLAESPMSLWDSFGMAEYALKISCDPQTDEVITLRIEPTEPCEYCADWVPPKIQPCGHIEPMYCDMCGRRLKCTIEESENG